MNFAGENRTPFADERRLPIEPGAKPVMCGGVVRV
jgi:hypothetical protein